MLHRIKKINMCIKSYELTSYNINTKLFTKQTNYKLMTRD